MTDRSLAAFKHVGIGSLALLLLARLSSFHFVTSVGVALMIPLPMLHIRLLAGRKAAFLALVGVLVLHAVLTPGPLYPESVLYFALLMALGAFLGEFLERGYFIGSCITFSVSASLGAVVVAGLVWPSATGEGSFWELIRQHVTANVEGTLGVYTNSGVAPTEGLQELREGARVFAQALLRVFPALTIMGLVFTAWVTLIVARKISAYRDSFTQGWNNLKEWRAPEFLVWPLVGAGFMILVPVDMLKTLGMNLILVILLPYFFQGLSIAAFFFDRKKVPTLIRGFAYAFIVLQQFATLFVVGLGLFDVWFNVRRLGKNPMEPINGES